MRVVFLDARVRDRSSTGTGIHNGAAFHMATIIWQLATPHFCGIAAPISCAMCIAKTGF